MCSKINLANIVFQQNSVITRVRCIVSSHVVNTTASGEGYSCLEFICLNQSSVSIFNILANIDQSSTWFDYTLGIPSHLSVALSSFSQSFIVSIEQAFLRSKLRSRNSLPVFIFIFTYFALWEITLRKLQSNGDSRRVGLLVLTRAPAAKNSKVGVVLLSGSVLYGTVCLSIFRFFSSSCFLLLVYLLIMFNFTHLLL